MQEVEQEIGRQLVIVVKGVAKLTPRLLAKALSIAEKTVDAPAEYHRKQTIKKEQKQTARMQRHGKMTVKELAEKDKGMTSIELNDSGFRDFSRIARKYGIDFAPYKVKGEKKFLIFFKAPDTDAMTACVQEYTKMQIRKAAKRRESVHKKLNDIQAGLKNPAPTAERHKEPVLS